MTQFVAPRMIGRMAPGLFSFHIGKTERFPGDPWPHLPVLPGLYWLHADGCGRSLYSALKVPPAYLDDPRAPTLRVPREPLPAISPAKSSTSRRYGVRPAVVAPAQCEMFAGVRV